MSKRVTQSVVIPIFKDPVGVYHLVAAAPPAGATWGTSVSTLSDVHSLLLAWGLLAEAMPTEQDHLRGFGQGFDVPAYFMPV